MALPCSSPYLLCLPVEANDHDLSPSHASCGSWGREKKVGYLLWLIDLHIVICIWQEEELGRWKQFMKASGHPDIQVRVARAEDDAHWWSERLHLRDPLRPISYGEEQILIQAKESGLGTGRGRKLVIEQGQEFLTVFCLSHESADLPPVHLPEEPIVKGFRDGACSVSHQRCGKEQDGFGWS